MPSHLVPPIPSIVGGCAQPTSSPSTIQAAPGSAAASAVTATAETATAATAIAATAATATAEPSSATATAAKASATEAGAGMSSQPHPLPLEEALAAAPAAAQGANATMAAQGGPCLPRDYLASAAQTFTSQSFPLHTSVLPPPSQPELTCVGLMPSAVTPMPFPSQPSAVTPMPSAVTPMPFPSQPPNKATDLGLGRAGSSDKPTQGQGQVWPPTSEDQKEHTQGQGHARLPTVLDQDEPACGHGHMVRQFDMQRRPDRSRRRTGGEGGCAAAHKAGIQLCIDATDPFTGKVQHSNLASQD